MMGKSPLSRVETNGGIKNARSAILRNQGNAEFLMGSHVFPDPVSGSNETYFLCLSGCESLIVTLSLLH